MSGELKGGRLCFFISTLLFSSTFFGCEEEKTYPIPPEKLTLVLRDVHIAEAAIGHLKASEKDSILNLYYEQIYEIHGIKKADLDTCIAWLKRDPKAAFSQYEKVHEELEKLNLSK